METKKTLQQQIKEIMEEVHNVHWQKVLDRKLKDNPSVSFLGDNEDVEYFVNINKQKQIANKKITVLA